MYEVIHEVPLHRVVHGVKHNTDIYSSVSKDGTSAVYRPVSVSDWLALNLPVPSYRYPCQEASGSLVDEVQGVSVLAAVAAPAYQQSGSEAAYATKGVKTTDGVATQGFSAATGLLWNCNTQNVGVYVEFELTASGGTRGLVTICGSTFLIAALSTGHLQSRHSVSGNVTGAIDYRDSKRHPLYVEFMPGAGVLGHTGAGLLRCSTDKEQFTGTWASVNNDNSKGIGGTVGTACTSTYFDLAAWTATDVATIQTMTPKVFLQRRGWTVTGY